MSRNEIAADMPDLNIREIEKNDLELVINYFLQADHTSLEAMGADPEKLPPFDEWHNSLIEDLLRSLTKRQFYYLIWEIDGSPIGHSNIAKIVFGDHAYMHLHLWKPDKRNSGNGTYFVKECISIYFEKFDLQYLLCEPYAPNPAPNKTLPKLGFEFVKQYDTTPGLISPYQSVNQWILRKETWLEIISTKPDDPV